MNELKKDHLNVKIYETRKEMGEAAAKDAALTIIKMLETKKELNIIFAAAPSQNEFLDAICKNTEIPWSKINAFHMDEYVGLKQGSPASFSGFLNNAVFDRVPFQQVHLITADQKDQAAECRRYGELLKKHPADLVFMGIGENGHIAFNDPGVADFEDIETVKIVELDLLCRKQQVNDGCFPTLSDVPTHAYTVTIPALVKAERILCIVPGIRKAKAAKDTLCGPVTEKCPASILRTRKQACLYLDADSASLLKV